MSSNSLGVVDVPGEVVDEVTPTLTVEVLVIKWVVLVSTDALRGGRSASLEIAASSCAVVSVFSDGADGAVAGTADVRLWTNGVSRPLSAFWGRSRRLF